MCVESRVLGIYCRNAYLCIKLRVEVTDIFPASRIGGLLRVIIVKGGMQHFISRMWMPVIRVSFITIIFMFIHPNLDAQDINQSEEKETRKTVAVLTFEGKGIVQYEAAALTDRLSTEINNTGAVRIVERGMMQEILTEQGFQQSGCTSAECAVEVGALLGVQYMISGSIGKIGDTYTIDAKMVSVQTGATDASKNVTYAGKVDGLITEIEILAWTILGLTPPNTLLAKQKAGMPAGFQSPVSPKTKLGAMLRSTVFPGLGQFYSDKSKWGYIWIGAEAAVGALAYLSYSQYKTANDDYTSSQAQYNSATDPNLIAEYRNKSEASHSDMEAANNQMKLMLYAGAGVWLANMVHAYMVGPTAEEQVLKNTSATLAYDPVYNQPKLELKIALE